MKRILLWCFIFFNSISAFAETKAIFTVDSNRIEKHIQMDDQRGIKAVLVSPVYSQINHRINNNALEFQTLKEKFIYTQEHDDKAVLLKEWIEAPEPNTKDGSTYIWQITSINSQEKIRLTKLNDKVLIQFKFPPLNGEPACRTGRGKGGVNVREGWNTVAQINPIIYFDRHNRQYRGTLSINPKDNTVIITVKAKPDQYPLRIDPTLRYGQWLGGKGGPAMVTSNLFNSGNNTIIIGGYIGTSGDIDLTVTMQGVYNGSTEGFILSISDGGTPSINWGQWIGGSSGDTILTMDLNGSNIYVGGQCNASTNFTTLVFQGTFNGTADAFIIKMTDGGTPVLNWGQWVGGSGSDSTSSIDIDGTSIYIGGDSFSSTNYTTLTFQGLSNGSRDGWVIKLTDGGTPTINWGQWLGGENQDFVKIVRVNGAAIYAGGYAPSSTKFTTLTFQGTHNGSSDIFVIKLTDGGTPTINWGQWLGGSGAELITTLELNGTAIYVGGDSETSTKFTTLTFQGANNGNSEGFIVKLTDGGTPTINWGQWLGGNGADRVQDIKINASTIYVGGYSNSSTNFSTVAFQGTHNGLSDGFVIKMTDGGTPTLNWGQWLGGNLGDIVYALSYTGSNIYIGGIANASTSFTTLTFQDTNNGLTEGFIIKLTDGGTPTLNWGQWIGGGASESAQIKSIVDSGSSVFLGGGAVQVNQIENLTFQGIHNGGTDGFVIKMTDGGTPTINWGQWLGGNGADLIAALGINGSIIYAAGYVGASTNMTTISFQGTHNGATEGFVVKLTDGGTPTINWGQWIGGNLTVRTDSVNAIAINGSSIYIGGSIAGSTNFTTITFQGAYGGNQDSFVIKMTDGGTPTINWGQRLGGTNDENITTININGSSIYVGGGSFTSTNWTTLTFQGTHNGSSDTFVIKLTDGGTPTINWGQWLGGNNTDNLTALALNGSNIFVGGYSSSSTNFTTMTFQGTYNGLQDGYVIKLTDGGTPSIKWGQWIGGNSLDAINAVILDGSSIYAGGYATSSTNFTTISFSGTYNGGSEAFIVKLTDGGTPTISWGQWIGGRGNDVINALAIDGAKIYIGGVVGASTSFTTLTFQGTLLSTSEAFVISIDDPAQKTLFFMDFAM